MQAKLSHLTNQRTRILLVAILGAVLLFLLLPSGKRLDSPAPSSEAMPNGQALVGHMVDSNTLEPASAPQTAQLPTIDMALILANNPFYNESAALADQLSSTAANGLKATQHSLKDSQARTRTSSSGTSEVLVATASNSDASPNVYVSAVITGSHRPAALIENKIYFENDEVADGWVIARIRPDRVSFVRTSKID